MFDSAQTWQHFVGTNTNIVAPDVKKFSVTCILAPVTQEVQGTHYP